jgi:hypothetical protein
MLYFSVPSRLAQYNSFHPGIAEDDTALSVFPVNGDYAERLKKAPNA